MSRCNDVSEEILILSSRSYDVKRNKVRWVADGGIGGASHECFVYGLIRLARYIYNTDVIS